MNKRGDGNRKLSITMLGVDDFTVGIVSGLMSFSLVSVAHNPRFRNGPDAHLFALIAEHEIVFLVASMFSCIVVYKLVKIFIKRFFKLSRK